MSYYTKKITKPLRSRLINKKGSQTKLKLFTQEVFQADHVFENQVNEFMASVEVIEVKADAFQDKYGIVRAVTVVYKEKGGQQ